MDKNHRPPTPTSHALATVNGIQDGGLIPAKKRPTVADNARAIDAMGSELASITSLLHQLVGKTVEVPLSPSPPAPAAGAEADPQYYLPATRGRQLSRHNEVRHSSAPSPHNDHPSDRAPDVPSQEYYPSWPRSSSSSNAREYVHVGPFGPPAAGSRPLVSDLDPLVSRPGFRPHRDFPTTLQGLEDDSQLQTHVTSLISASLAPMAAISGKKAFAHSFIAHGIKRSKTTLGDLSIPEYNTGFIRLINFRATKSSDKPHMFRHLEFINEDAINYEWSDVRAWSEEMCALMAEGELRWSDEYHLDLFRIKLSQRRRLVPGTQPGEGAVVSISRPTRDTTSDICYYLNPDLKAAKPGPPCKQFNIGNCPHTGDHVLNGYRHLHVCNHCLSAKCLFWPHAEKGCRTKDFSRKRTTTDAAASGFGK